jgi:hypothetical protein
MTARRNYRRNGFLGKHGQAQQVFLYIMAAVVLAVIFLFGYNAINGFIEKGERVTFISFQTDLQEAVRGLSSRYGSVIVYNNNNPFAVPAQYKKVCFVDLDTDPNSGGCDELSPLACDAWETAHASRSAGGDWAAWDAAEENVFLEPVGLLPIKVFHIKINPGEGGKYICIDTTDGQLDVRLEGRGDHTLISSLTPEAS